MALVDAGWDDDDCSFLLLVIEMVILCTLSVS